VLLKLQIIVVRYPACVRTIARYNVPFYGKGIPSYLPLAASNF
jgi:hypothetical protein